MGRKLKRCGNPIRVERYGGGIRYYCPLCDTFRSNGMRFAWWIHATPPSDGLCHKEVSK